MLTGLFSRGGKGFWETVRNIGWTSVAKIVRMGGSLVVGTLVVRYLGPFRYGVFSYAIAIYGLFNIISNLGLDYLVVSDVALAKDVATEEEVLGTALILKILASVVTTAAAAAYAWFTHREEHTVFIIVVMLSVASIAQGFDVIDYYFQAKTRSRLIVLPQIVVFIISNLARVAAVLLKSSLLVFGAIYALEILFTELSFAWVYWFYHRNLMRWRFERQRAVALMKASWPLLIASLLVIVYMRTDQILLGILSTKTVVGEYSAASKLSEIWYAIPSLICASVMPRLLRNKESDPAKYYARLERLYGMMAAFSICLAIGVSFFGRYAVLLLFGKAYLSATNILSVLIWTGPFVFLGVGAGMQLIHEGLTKISLQRSIAGAMCNIALNYLLIPRFGGVGSAMATLTTQVVAAYLMDAVNRDTRHIFRMKTRALTGLWLFSGQRFALNAGAP